MRSALCGIVAASVFLAATFSPAGAQEVRAGGPVSITIRGFVGTTMFVQDGSFAFGNGQNAQWALLDQPTDDPWILGGDMRNTRLTLAMTGPEIVREWRPGATIEMDFFGGFVTPIGAFSDEQPLPRLRLAYVDLVRGATTLRFGQNWAPLFGYVPVSVSHLGFPLGYGGGGLIGWRFPGIFLYQNLTEAEAPVRAQLQLAAMRNSWVAPEADIIAQRSPGEASMIPQLQARLDFTGRTEGITWGSYIVGHWDRKDLSGVGDATENNLDGRAIEIGVRVVPGPLTLHGNAYWGRAIGQQIAQIVQFGDIAGWGAWGQVGYQIHPNFSAWLFYGQDDPDDEDIRALPVTTAPRLLNRNVAAMGRFNAGPYMLGAEWFRATTDWRTGTLGGDVRRQANQFALSAFFAF